MEILTELAKKSYQRHSFLSEWRAFILITLVVKLGAMTFSIFAGYFYFKDVFSDLLPFGVLPSILAIVNLVLIEVMTATTISKFFKFLIRGSIKYSLSIALLALGLFSVSFISSTQGLAMRQGELVNYTTTIDSNYQELRQDIINDYTVDTASINNRIRVIEENPQGWEGRKKSKLLSVQLLQIDLYYKDLRRSEDKKDKALKEAKVNYKAELKVNTQEVTTEADRYYKIVAIVMVLIFLVNGLLMFFYSKIFEEVNSELAELEVSQELGKTIQVKADKLINSKIRATMSKHFKELEVNSKQTIAELPPHTNGCKNCGKEFEKEKPAQLYCSNSCRLDYWKKQ